MLSDKQIDDLERLIVFGTMDDLPLILSRAIPVLFAELRLVRATLDSRVNDFLQGGLSNAGGVPQGDSHEGTDSGSAADVPERSQQLGLDREVHGSGQQEHDPVVDRGQERSELASGVDYQWRSGSTC